MKTLSEYLEIDERHKLKKTIGFDLDDVVVNTNAYLSKRILDEKGIDFRNRTNPRSIKIPGMSKEENDKYMAELYEDAFVKSEPNYKSIETLKKISKDFNIVFITARHINKGVKENTRNWLKKYIRGYFEYDVRFSDGKSKVPLITDDIKIFVEDHPYYISDLSKTVDVVFVMEQPWNRNRKFAKNAWSVKDFDDLYKRLMRNKKGMELI